MRIKSENSKPSKSKAKHAAQEVTRVFLSRCGMEQGETLHIVKKMREYWMNETLMSSCKKEKV